MPVTLPLVELLPGQSQLPRVGTEPVVRGWRDRGGEHWPDLADGQRGEAGDRGHRDVRTAGHGRQPEQAGGLRTERLIGPGEDRAYVSRRVVGVKDIQSGAGIPQFTRDHAEREIAM